MSVIVDLLDLRQSHAFQLAAISGVAGAQSITACAAKNSIDTHADLAAHAGREGGCLLIEPQDVRWRHIHQKHVSKCRKDMPPDGQLVCGAVCRICDIWPLVQKQPLSGPA